MEYVYSILERGRLAALAGDRLMAQPVILDVGYEAWRAKEARATDGDADVKAVRAAVRGAVLKVIIESAALTGPELALVVRLAADAGADFVKTSTGYHPSGGATVAAVSAMRTALDGRPLGIKASGGVRTVEFARELIAAGATRLGTSSGVALVS
jgi:deoxyribose-phosphate aldolase